MAKTLNTGSRGGDLRKEGIYLLEVQDVDAKVAQSGNDILNIRYSVIKGGRPSGPSIFDIITLTEIAMWRWTQLMDALEAPEGEDVDPETWLLGKQVYARIVIEEWNDEDRNKVKAYLTPLKAEKLMAKESEADLLSPEPMVSSNGSKAKSRARTGSSAPELSAEESMPL